VLRTVVATMGRGSKRANGREPRWASCATLGPRKANSRSVWAMFRASSGNARCVGLPFVRFLHRSETLHSLGTDRRNYFRMKAVRSGRRCASTGLGSLHRSLFAAIAPRSEEHTSELQSREK